MRRTSDGFYCVVTSWLYNGRPNVHPSLFVTRCIYNSTTRSTVFKEMRRFSMVHKHRAHYPWARARCYCTDTARPNEPHALVLPNLMPRCVRRRLPSAECTFSVVTTSSRVLLHVDPYPMQCTLLLCRAQSMSSSHGGNSNTIASSNY